ncbi:type III secretion system export apparatus subunit SctT [Serratia marcescens]|uniref:type III secretion system export apparatus subunit SctT n=1 Tax=Serratia marcescens TaxID=615 RepID=UPI0029D56014|nr:type III secretion system export apparatus subunit SctT [Serratia marcescens]
MLWGDLLDQLFQYLLALLLGMARVFPCVLLTPIFSFNVFKGVPRAAIVAALALVIAPGLQAAIAANPPELLTLTALGLKELILGALLGLVLGLPFWMMESVGALFDNQRGALMGGQLNPLLGPDVTPLGHLMQQTMILLLMVGPGLGTMTQVLWDSYRLWPALAWMPLPGVQGWGVWLGLLKTTFVDMVLYAGPLVALLLLLDFAVGIISIYSPQIQATVLTIPAKCLLGLLFFVLYLPVLNHLAGERLFELRNMSAILGMLLPSAEVSR